MLKNLNLYYQKINLAIKENISNFESLKNSTILITGITGMIGSCLMDVIFVLNEEYKYNTKVIGMIRNKSHLPERFKHYDFLKIKQQDIIDHVDYNDKLDYVIHAASNADPNSFAKYPVDTMMCNFVGIKNILDCAHVNDAKKVLFVSSGEIYGQGSDNMVSFSEEDSGRVEILNSRSCYPVSKIASETLCCAYSEQYGIQTVIARPCHTYGPTQTERDSRASSQFIRAIVDDLDIVMKSDGSQIRSYCNVIDNVTGLLTILCKGISGNAYNVANNNSVVSIREFAEILCKCSNKKIKYDNPTAKEKNSFNRVTRSVLNGEKLMKLGWKPIFGIVDGLKMTMDAMKG